MAEFMFKDWLKKQHLEDVVEVASSGTSTEELGNPVHPGTVARLAKEGISCRGKFATQLKKSDYDKYDFLLCMDQNNVRNALRILGSDPHQKVVRLLDLTGKPSDIADPWYTGNFDQTYTDIEEGIRALGNAVKVSLKNN